MDEGYKLDFIAGKPQNPRRQDCKQTYYVNGALFLFKSALLKGDTVLNAGEHGYVMNPEDSIDLDETEDLKKIEAIFKAKNKKFKQKHRK